MATLTTGVRLLSWLRFVLPLALLLLALLLELREDMLVYRGHPDFPLLPTRHHDSFYLEVLIFGLAGPVVLGICLHWMMNGIKRLDRAHASERALRYELEAEAQARRELLAATLQSQEAERQRVARELHDGIGQPLTTFLMMTEADEDALEKSPALRHAHLAATDTLEAIRRLILDLRPALLDTQGLLPALRQSAERSLTPTGIEVQVTAVGDPLPLAKEAETTLFRIGQEAFTNIARHAQATRAHITLEFQPAQVRDLWLVDTG